MNVVVIGCSGSFAGPQSPASCYLVQAEHEGRTWNLLLDFGNGALGVLQRHIDPRDVDAVALSHLHPDHCSDMSGYYVFRKYFPEGALPGGLPVYGPDGTRGRLARMYGVDNPEDQCEQYDYQTLSDGLTFQVGPFTCTSLLVNHPVEAYGFRVEADGAVLAYSGDTDETPALAELARGADLFLADSAFVDGRDTAPGVHLSGSRAAQAALDAGGVKRLVLTHIPPWNDAEVCREQAQALWPQEVEIASSGATYQL